MLIRRSSTWCRCSSRSPSRKAITTCRSWRRPGATALIAAVDLLLRSSTGGDGREGLRNRQQQPKCLVLRHARSQHRRADRRRRRSGGTPIAEKGASYAGQSGLNGSKGATTMYMNRLFGMLAGATVALAAAPVSAQTDLKFALDWKFEGPAAPYFVAIDKGYYKAEGLNVTIDSGPGSVAGIARVAAGTYPIGFFDINSLVKFQDQNPDKKVQAVLMIYDKPPFAIATTAKTGITKPKDLEGRVLGAPAADGAFAQWKAFVKENDIDTSKVKIENVGFPVREPMLAEGKVDAITGFSFSIYYNLLQKGLK